MGYFTRVAVGVVALLTLTACAWHSEEQAAAQQIVAMDTAMSFSVYDDHGEQIIQTAVKEIRRLETLLDRTEKSSGVSQLNNANGKAVAVGEELRGLLAAAKDYTAATGGAFDITVAPVVSAWGFTESEFRVPSPAELDNLLPYVGGGRIHLTGDTVTVLPKTQIDLGGIAKGYAADCLAQIFAEAEVEQGAASLGGNVLAWGRRPDGAPWRVGIQDPRHPTSEKLVGMLELENAFAVTSGGYQRFFEENGQTYHHIIDPATGYPANSGLTSVTVVADCNTKGNGTMCDALSTALFVMGEERALEFWRSGTYDFELVLVTEDDRVLVTSGIADRFTETEGSRYIYETVS